jgi:hypothetical protein
MKVYPITPLIKLNKNTRIFQKKSIYTYVYH